MSCSVFLWVRAHYILPMHKLCRPQDRNANLAPKLNQKLSGSSLSKKEQIQLSTHADKNSHNEYMLAAFLHPVQEGSVFMQLAG